MTTTDEFIRHHRTDDVRQLALQSSRFLDVDVPYALRQIEGWQTACRKWPSWAARSGIVYPPRVNMEQSSSEATARYKASVAARVLRQEGVDSSSSAMADLTGGYGVDFSFLSPLFRQALYVERDGQLCQIARHNFGVLGMKNVEVRNGDSIDFLRQMEPVGMLYLDPSRRDSHGGRTYALEDCTPDVVACHDLLLRKARVVLLKVSPMLDWHLAVGRLGSVGEVHIVGTGGECKELLLVLTRHATSPKVWCVSDGERFCYDADATPSVPAISTFPVAGQLLLVPNATIMKAGCFGVLSQAFGITPVDANSHLFVADGWVAGFPGRQFRIDAVSSFNKKELRAALAGVGSANVAVRNFPMTSEALRRRLRLRDGGPVYLFATTSMGRHVLLRCHKE